MYLVDFIMHVRVQGIVWVCLKVIMYRKTSSFDYESR